MTTQHGYSPFIILFCAGTAFFVADGIFEFVAHVTCRIELSAAVPLLLPSALREGGTRHKQMTDLVTHETFLALCTSGVPSLEIVIFAFALL
jgi:hypothetical protein